MSRFGYQTLGFGAGGAGGTPYKVVDEVASDGSVTTDGDFKIHTFTSSGDFVVTSPGLTDNTIQYLMVGGGGLGGGGATSNAVSGGGGGAVSGSRKNGSADLKPALITNFSKVL